jgi:3-oxoadipate enol-lactonase
VADGRYLAGTIPGANFLELNASHLSNIEADKKFNAAVLQFLLA